MSYYSKDSKFIKRLILEGNYNKALKKIEDHLKVKNIDKIKRIEYLLLKCIILVGLGNHKEAIILTTDILTESLKKKQYTISIEIATIQSEALWRLGELDEALKVIQKGEELVTEIEDSSPKEIASLESGLLINKGVVNGYKGNVDLSLEYTFSSLAKAKESNDHQKEAVALNNIGVSYSHKGDLDTALTYYKKCFNLTKKTGYKELLLISNNNIAEHYQFTGELNKALGIYNQSLKIAKEMGAESQISYTYDYIAQVYKIKGELNRALECHNKSLKIRYKMGDKIGITDSYLTIGSVLREMGNFSQSVEYFKQALSIADDTGVGFNIAFALYNLAILFIENNQLDLAYTYFQRLKELKKTKILKTLDQQSRIVEALLLTTHNTLRAKTDAQKIFQDICEEDIIDYTLTVFSIIKLCELLLFELQLFGSRDVLIKLEKYSNKLIETAKSEKSYTLLVKSYLLQSRICMIEGELVKAEELLTQASTTATEKGLGRLSLEITKEKSSYIQIKAQMETGIKHEERIIQKNQISQLDSLLARMVISKTSQIERQRQELSDFVHHLAHDLRNYVTQIYGYADLIRLHGPDDKYLDVIIRSTKRMKEMVDHSVELADAGLIINTVDEVDLNKLVDDAAEFNIPDTVVFTRDDLPVVICDSVRINQVFKNLFENAIIHGKTTKKVTITRTDHLYGINLLISNDGLSIPLDSQDKIFQRGYTTKKGNTGLGMTIVKRIIGAHGWQIAFDPNASLTTFKILIPTKLKPLTQIGY